MFITYTAYPLNTNRVKRYNGVTSSASGYGNVRLICQLPDGKMETIILQEVVHLPGSFNLIRQCRIIDKDIKGELVNYADLNLDNRHGKVITTAPQVDGQYVLDRALELTEYSHIDDSRLQAPKTTEHASRHNAEKQMSGHRLLPHVGFKALDILPKVVPDAQKMTRKWN
jgi:hypothetical protein